MYKITTEQIKTIKDLVYNLNAGVQLFIALEKMLDGLPKIEGEDTKSE